MQLFNCAVSAGFPSPADDYVEGTLDLNEHLIKNAAATYFVRVSGDSMTGAGIHDGDLLIVDRSITPADGSIVIASHDGEFTVKRLRHRNGRPLLVPENINYQPIALSGDDAIFGVVTYAIHKAK
ncbi:translesion error-prone DNA polymerase V autoproteolytic subunit [Candidatus Sumerlaeota bacterium]|nr:translesion error-prone DNA polymerase V autoproteolytic subunit [Candidatus Sumerlaeota bacterium]